MREEKTVKAKVVGARKVRARGYKKQENTAEHQSRSFRGNSILAIKNNRFSFFSTLFWHLVFFFQTISKTEFISNQSVIQLFILHCAKYVMTYT